jgi:hypothetical protein
MRRNDVIMDMDFKDYLDYPMQRYPNDDEYRFDRVNDIINQRILMGAGAHRKRSGSKVRKHRKGGVLVGGSKSRRKVVKRRKHKRGGVMAGGSKRRVMRHRKHKRGGVMAGGSKHRRKHRKVAKRMRGGSKSRRRLSPYNAFVKKHMKNGMSMKEVAKKWNKMKKKPTHKRKARRVKRGSGYGGSKTRRRVHHKRHKRTKKY